MKRGINWRTLIVSLALVYLAALIGSVFTSQSVNSQWYQSIKPSITPPSWVFPIVWNILFFLIALSLYFAWINSNKKEKKVIAAVFALNLIFNMSWSFIFFYLQNPAAGFYDIILILISIIWMIKAASRINKLSAYLLVPYLLWVSFATILNYLIAF